MGPNTPRRNIRRQAIQTQRLTNHRLNNNNHIWSNPKRRSAVLQNLRLQGIRLAATDSSLVTFHVACSRILRSYHKPTRYPSHNKESPAQSIADFVRSKGTISQCTFNNQIIHVYTYELFNI